MLAALTEFYRQMGIYSCEFHCKHFDSCKKAAEKAICREKQKWEERREALRKAEEASDDEREKLAEEKKTLSRHGRFTQVGSTYVGTEYDKSGCRLLFLSLDPGSDDPSDDALPDKFPGLRDSQDDPCRRTPEGMREGVIKGLKPNGVKRKWVHWYGTHYLAARILQKAANYPANETSGRVCKVLDGKADRKEKEKKLPCVTPYFAHANVVKCSIGRLGNLQAPDQMYENCHEYLKGELPLLRPDIIVTQGKKAAEALVKLYPPVRRVAGSNDRLQYLTLRESEDVLWIPTYHPRYGRFWTEGRSKDGVRWGVYADDAEKFMVGKRKRRLA